MKMEDALLQAMGAQVQGHAVTWDEDWAPQEWQALFHAAVVHRVLPMVYEAVRLCPAFQRAEAADLAVFAPYKREVKQQVMIQTARTAELQALLARLSQAGVTPVVVKGVVCREVYPLPDARPSGDEDLVIPPHQLTACDAVLRECGMRPLGELPAEPRGEDITYVTASGFLHLEVHTALFPPDAAAYGSFNRLLDGWEQRTVTRTVAGSEMRVMEHTDHLLYLILHALKHFTHSGVGVRQACDIARYAEAYGREIHWVRLLSACRAASAEGFVLAVLEIGRRYFGLRVQDEVAAFPEAWRHCPVSPDPLLRDMVEGGVYGQAVKARFGGGIFTENAVVAARQGGAQNRAAVLWRTLFPSARTLAGQYPYLQRFPVLLPVAWGQRLVARLARARDAKELRESYAYGKQRAELMKQYGIIK